MVSYSANVGHFFVIGDQNACQGQMLNELNLSLLVSLAALPERSSSSGLVVQIF